MRSLLLFDMVNNLLQCTLVSGRWSPPADIQRVESFLCSLWPQASGLSCTGTSAHSYRPVPGDSHPGGFAIRHWWGGRSGGNVGSRILILRGLY